MDAESTVISRSRLDLDGVVVIYSEVKARRLDVRADPKLSWTFIHFKSDTSLVDPETLQKFINST